MCDLTMALGIASSVASFAGDAAKAGEENRARAKNRTAAVVDYNNQTTLHNHNYTQNTKTTNAEGFDAALAARDAMGKQRAEAASQGAAGLSVDAVLNDLVAQNGRNQLRVQDKHDANLLDYDNQMTTAHTNATNRVNGNQPVSGPSPLGLAINIAGAFVK